MHHTRRHVIMGAASIALMAPFSGISRASLSEAEFSPRDGELDFDVFRNGSAIGHHKIDLQQDGNRTTARIDILLEVGIGPLVLYRYCHQNTEIWEDGSFKSFASRTDDDGTPYAVQAVRNQSVIRVTRDHDQDYDIDDLTVLPTTYWNEKTVHCNQLLDTQKGRLMAVTVKPQGWQTVRTAAGMVEAQGFAISGDIELNLWYDRKNQWTKLSFPFKGDEFDYQLV
ncbi:DUF6134 family protein [Hwanghaeella sp. LZ110]|uniref:DUF6134 family protein n=1 Tax=Hwanghaeella sp. LZ110 TaxID=3402810 RepID=UPI003B673033